MPSDQNTLLISGHRKSWYYKRAQKLFGIPTKNNTVSHLYWKKYKMLNTKIRAIISTVHENMSLRICVSSEDSDPFVYVEVLLPSKPFKVMSSAVCLPNHTFSWAGLDL